MSRDFIGNGVGGVVDCDGNYEDAKLPTRDVSLLSSLSSFDNDDEQQLRHHRGIAAPLRESIHPSSNIKKSSLDLPQLDHLSRLTNNYVSSTDCSSSVVIIDSKRHNNNNMTSSSFRKEKEDKDKKIEEDMMATTTHTTPTLSALSSASSTIATSPLLPVIPPIIATDHHSIRDNSSHSYEAQDNDDAASFYSVPHLMRTCDSQDEEDDDDDDDDDSEIHDSLQDFNDYCTDFDVNAEDIEHSNINSTSSSSSRGIEISLTDNAFGTEVSMAPYGTVFSASPSSSSSSHQHPRPPPSIASNFPPEQQQLNLQEHWREQQVQRVVLPPSPQNNSISHLTTTPIMCNRRQKLQIKRCNEESINNKLITTATSSSSISMHNRSIQDRVHDESKSNNMNDKYVITFPGGNNNCEIEVSSSSTASSVPTLPLFDGGVGGI